MASLGEHTIGSSCLLNDVLTKDLLNVYAKELIFHALVSYHIYL